MAELLAVGMQVACLSVKAPARACSAHISAWEASNEKLGSLQIHHSLIRSSKPLATEAGHVYVRVRVHSHLGQRLQCTDIRDE